MAMLKLWVGKFLTPVDRKKLDDLHAKSEPMEAQWRKMGETMTQIVGLNLFEHDTLEEVLHELRKQNHLLQSYRRDAIELRQMYRRYEEEIKEFFAPAESESANELGFHD